MTSPPSANAFSVSSTAAALLLTTIVAMSCDAEFGCPIPPSFGGVGLFSNFASNRLTWTSRFPRSPVAKSSSMFEYPCATSTTCRSASTLSGARPRFVCRITPVALITGRSEYDTMLETLCSMALSASPRAIGKCIGSKLPDTSLSLNSLRKPRVASTTLTWPARAASCRNPSLRSNSSTLGSSRNNSEFVFSLNFASSLCLGAPSLSPFLADRVGKLTADCSSFIALRQLPATSHQLPNLHQPIPSIPMCP